MIQLPNGCRRSEFNIFPANWKTLKAKITETWYFDCRFIDPEQLRRFPKGKLIRIKGGMNRFKTIEERRTALETKLQELEELFKSGYNPIQKDPIIKSHSSNFHSDLPVSEVLPSTPFIKALWFVHSKSLLDTGTLADCKSAIRSLERSAIVYGYEKMPIGDIQVKHIKRCLDLCHTSNPKFSGKRYNKVKAYLSGLFKELIQLGAIEGNMALAVSPMKEKAAKPIIFSNDEIEIIKKHLFMYNRPFYNFMMLFFYNGGRLKELFRLKGSDINLVDQKYCAIVKKGKKERWVDRTIRNVALPFWVEQMQNCKADDYIFSVNLMPGKQPINSKQVSRRWTTHVKKPLGIKATFYKLKHVNTDRTLAAVGARMAANQNAHLSTKMVEDVYAYNEKKRIHETLKALGIQL